MDLGRQATPMQVRRESVKKRQQTISKCPFEKKEEMIEMANLRQEILNPNSQSGETRFQHRKEFLGAQFKNLSQSCTAQITRHGGQVDVGGCSINFSPGVFERSTVVQAKAEINGAHSPPEGYIFLTAVLSCIVGGEMNGEATVKLPTWCFAKQSSGLVANVLHRSNVNSPWRKFKTVPITGNGVFTFTTRSFSNFSVAIAIDRFSRFFASLGIMSINLYGHVYAERRDNLYVYLFLNHSRVFVERDMHQSGFSLLFPFGPLLVKLKNEINVCLECRDSPGFAVGVQHATKTFECKLTITEAFLRRVHYASFSTCIIGDTRAMGQFIITRTILQNGEIVLGPENFTYAKQSPLQYQNRKVRMETEDETPNKVEITHRDNKYEATNMYFDGRNNKYDHRQYPETARSTENSTNDMTYQDQSTQVNLVAPGAQASKKEPANSSTRSTENSTNDMTSSQLDLVPPEPQARKKEPANSSKRPTENSTNDMTSSQVPPEPQASKEEPENSSTRSTENSTNEMTSSQLDLVPPEAQASKKDSEPCCTIL